MKALKITLAIIVVAAIGAGFFFWIQSIKEPDTVKAPKNQFTAKIEQEIEQLKAKPDNEFCKDFYNKVALDIKDFYEQNRFDSSNQSANIQWKENFEKNLYSVYADKFIKQAFYVLRNSEWRYQDRRFIQAEKNALINSRFLVAGSPVNQEFTKIQIALNKYYEIVRFISSCNNFTYLGSNLSDRFPIADVQSKIQHAASLRSNRLENEFVNNCTRLHNKLNEIPQSLFRVHVRYLDHKISDWSDMYSNYTSQRDYSNNLYNPLKNEIDDLGNSTMYNGVYVDDEYNRLLQRWSNDNTKAYNYTYLTSN